MSKGVPVDLELKKAFGELQEKTQETSKKILSIDAQIRAYEHDMELNQAYESEIRALTPETKVYEAVARTFIITDKEVVLNTMQKQELEMSTRIEELKKSKKFLEKSLDECTNNLREMVQHRKGQSEGEPQKPKLN